MNREEWAKMVRDVSGLDIPRTAYKTWEMYDRLQAEVERLEDEIAARNAVELSSEEMKQAVSKIKELEAENAELRNQLQQIDDELGSAIRRPLR